MMDDEQLLGAYVPERSESAFAELVARHIDFAYSAALRAVNADRHLPQDVSQTVFIDLAGKAGSLPRGVLFLVRANKERLDLIDQRKLTEAETWAHLAVAGDELFVRELNALDAYRWLGDRTATGATP